MRLLLRTDSGAGEGRFAVRPQALEGLAPCRAPTPGVRFASRLAAPMYEVRARRFVVGLALHRWAPSGGHVWLSDGAIAPKGATTKAGAEAHLPVEWTSKGNKAQGGRSVRAVATPRAAAPTRIPEQGLEACLARKKPLGARPGNGPRVGRSEPLA
jgi:hypothetical protein